MPAFKKLTGASNKVCFNDPKTLDALIIMAFIWPSHFRLRCRAPPGISQIQLWPVAQSRASIMVSCIPVLNYNIAFASLEAHEVLYTPLKQTVQVILEEVVIILIVYRFIQQCRQQTV